MSILTTQQLRSAYMEFCFQQQTKLTAEEFQRALYQSYNTIVSLLTASMITGDLPVSEPVKTETRELAYA
jgi:hypothetical protein